MCDPVSAGIAMAVGAGASLFGSMKQASAQRDAAQAVADQNQANLRAQNEGFTARTLAGTKQTAAQLAAGQETLAGRNAAFETMREGQRSSLQNYQDTINAQNATAEELRQRGDVASQQLLDATTGQQLADAQERRRLQQQALVAENLPGEQGPATSDPVERAAAARRTAEAATNIRTYGSRIAAADAYGAPAQEVKLAAGDTAYGIMPAVVAEKLLQSGFGARLLPSQASYKSATNIGGAEDTLAAARGQSAIDTAALSYGNETNLANLRQSNEQTEAKNISDQAQANAKAKAAQGSIISSLGNLALYGAGYFGGPSLSGLFSGAEATVPNVARSPLSPLAGIGRSPLSPLGGGIQIN